MSPWERQQNESRKAFQAFCAYRKLGPQRSLDAAWREFAKRKRGVAPGSWTKWSRLYEWVKRADAYDHYLESRERAAFEKDLLKLGARRAHYEFKTQDYAEELVESLRAAVKKHDAAPVTDVERKEEGETLIKASGEVTTTKTVTKVKAMKTSGFARLAKEFREAMKQAVIGVRPPKEESNSNVPLPPIIVSTRPDEPPTDPAPARNLRE